MKTILPDGFMFLVGIITTLVWIRVIAKKFRNVEKVSDFLHFLTYKLPPWYPGHLTQSNEKCETVVMIGFGGRGVRKCGKKAVIFYYGNYRTTFYPQARYATSQAFCKKHAPDISYNFERESTEEEYVVAKVMES